MKQITIILYALFILTCSNRNFSEKGFKKMFLQAMRNNSTSSNYVVIHIIKSNTNEQKDLCCTFRVLDYAMYLDSQKINIDKLKYKNGNIPIFEFKTEKALAHIGFHDYNTHIVDSLFLNTNKSLINEILKEYKLDYSSSLLESNTQKFGKNYFEHYLFMNGISTYQDCESGYTVIDLNN